MAPVGLGKRFPDWPGLFCSVNPDAISGDRTIRVVASYPWLLAVKSVHPLAVKSVHPWPQNRAPYYS